MMSIKVANSRFIHSSLKRWVGLYQQIMDISDLDGLGKWLVAECEKAQAFRETKKLKEMSLLLSGIPIQEYQLIGQFYQGYARVSQNPRKVFEDVVEKSKTYKSIALIALATLELQAGNCDSGISFCTEAIRYTNNVSIMVHAARSIAVIKSVEGFHTTALKDLERIAPLVRYASPMAGCQYYNSCAVELGEAGRLQEAQNISNIVLASPYAFAYPEWRETGSEIAQKSYSSRSVISFGQNQLRDNVLQLPQAEPGDSFRLPSREPARILNYTEWKKKMVKEPNDKDKPELKNMSGQELLLKIIQLSSHDETTDEQLRKILEAVLKIKSKP